MDVGAALFFQICIIVIIIIIGSFNAFRNSLEYEKQKSFYEDGLVIKDVASAMDLEKMLKSIYPNDMIEQENEYVAIKRNGKKLKLEIKKANEGGILIKPIYAKEFLIPSINNLLLPGKIRQCVELNRVLDSLASKTGEDVSIDRVDRYKKAQNAGVRYYVPLFLLFFSVFVLILILKS